MIKALFLHTSTLFVGLTVAKLLSTIIFILLATRLSPEDFGSGVFFVTLLTLITFISDSGLVQWFQKNYHAEAESQLLSNLFNARIITFICAFAFASFYILFVQPFSGYVSILFLFSLLPEAMLSFVDGYFLVQKRSYKLALKQISKLLLLGVSLIFVSAFSLHTAVFFLTLGSYLTLFWYFPWSMIKKWQFSLSQGVLTLQKAVKYGVLILTSTLYSRGDSIIIEIFLGRAPLGLYSIAYRYLETINLLPSALSQNLFHLTAKKGQITSQQLVKVLSIMFGLGMIASITMYLYAHLLSTAFGLLSADYLHSAPVIQVFSVVILLFFLNAPLSTFVQSSDFLKKFLPWGVINTVLNLVLNILFVPFYGILAAAWIMVLTEFTGLLINLYFTYHRLEKYED